MPIVLNKMIIGMFNGKSEISSKFIMSYFQYVLLYKKLCDEFEDENKFYEKYKNCSSQKKTNSTLEDNEKNYYPNSAKENCYIYGKYIPSLVALFNNKVLKSSL